MRVYPRAPSPERAMIQFPRSWSSLLLLVTLAVAVVSFSGCSKSEQDKLVGTYQSTSDAKDRIELQSGGKARVAALVGRPIDVWESGTAAPGVAGELQAARRATASVEAVDATYEVISPGTIKIEAAGRGTRILTIDVEAGILRSPGRTYLSRD